MNKTLTVLVSLLISTSVFCSEFHYFEITKKLTEKYAKTEYQKKDKLAPLLQKVWEKVKAVGIDKINDLTKEIIDYRQDFSLGEMNTPGFSWDMTSGNVGIRMGRILEPAGGGDEWLVVDRMVLDLSAQSFLKSLRDQGDVEITDANLKLFAGIRFKRTYTYRHIASSYLKGLTGSFDKLLFGLLTFQGTKYTELDDGDLVSKDDFLSADVSLAMDTPSIYFMSGYGRSTLYYSKLSSLTYQRPTFHDRSDDEALRVSFRSSKIKGASLQIGLQADFYKLLKLTLLSTEYRTSISTNQTTNMKFSTGDIERIIVDRDLQEAMAELNNGKSPDVSMILMPYITSHQEGLRIDQSLDLSALLWGKHIGNSTEQMTFETAGTKRFFFRHQQERVAINRSLLQLIFASKDIGKYNTRIVENMDFEYEVNSPDTHFEDTKLDMPAQATIKLSKEFVATKNRKSYRKKAIKWIERFENLDNGIIQGIEDGQLKGPFVLNLHAQVGLGGVAELVGRDVLELGDAFEIVCSGEDLEDGEKVKKKVKKCIEKLYDQFTTLKQDIRLSNQVDLKAFKNFLETVSNNASGFSVLKNLFGEEHVHLQGSFQAITNDKKPFMTFLKEGLRQGYGLIKDFIKNQL